MLRENYNSSFGTNERIRKSLIFVLNERYLVINYTYLIKFIAYVCTSIYTHHSCPNLVTYICDNYV